MEVVGRVSRQLSAKLEDDPEWSERLAADPGAFGFITYANGVRMAVDCMSDVLLPYTYMFCGTRGRLDVFERGWDIQYRARSADVGGIRDAKETTSRPRFRRCRPGLRTRRCRAAIGS